MLVKQLVSIVSINPLSPSQVMQGAWFGKVTRLGMVSGLGNLIPLNWASLAVSGSLAHGTGCTGARSGAVLQWEWRHWCCVVMLAPGHTRQYV